MATTIMKISKSNQQVALLLYKYDQQVDFIVEKNPSFRKIQ